MDSSRTGETDQVTDQVTAQVSDRKSSYPRRAKLPVLK